MIPHRPILGRVDNRMRRQDLADIARVVVAGNAQQVRGPGPANDGRQLLHVRVQLDPRVRRYTLERLVPQREDHMTIGLVTGRCREPELFAEREAGIVPRIVLDAEKAIVGALAVRATDGPPVQLDKHSLGKRPIEQAIEERPEPVARRVLPVAVLAWSDVGPNVIAAPRVLDIGDLAIDAITHLVGPGWRAGDIEGLPRTEVHAPELGWRTVIGEPGPAPGEDRPRRRRRRRTGGRPFQHPDVVHVPGRGSGDRLAGRLVVVCASRAQQHAVADRHALDVEIPIQHRGAGRVEIVEEPYPDLGCRQRRPVDRERHIREGRRRDIVDLGKQHIGHRQLELCVGPSNRVLASSHHDVRGRRWRGRKNGTGQWPRRFVGMICRQQIGPIQEPQPGSDEPVDRLFRGDALDDVGPDDIDVGMTIGRHRPSEAHAGDRAGPELGLSCQIDAVEMRRQRGTVDLGDVGERHTVDDPRIGHPDIGHPEAPAGPPASAGLVIERHTVGRRQIVTGTRRGQAPEPLPRCAGRPDGA